MRRFEGRIAAIVGGGSGMGRAISHRLASEGATVYVADLSEESAKKVAEEITAQGGKAVPVQVDATNNDSLRALFDRIRSDHGVLHVLHAQVGMPGPGGIETSDEEWQKNIDVNIKSAYYTCTLGYDLLKAANGKGRSP